MDVKEAVRKAKDHVEVMFEGETCKMSDWRKSLSMNRTSGGLLRLVSHAYGNTKNQLHGTRRWEEERQDRAAVVAGNTELLRLVT